MLIVGNIQYCNLSWCQSGWESFFVFFDQDIDEVFKGIQYCMVQYDWCFVFGIVGYILGIQMVWYGEIYLNGVVLLDLVDIVFQGEFDFGIVECVFIW